MMEKEGGIRRVLDAKKSKKRIEGRTPSKGRFSRFLENTEDKGRNLKPLV
jgi:hypothetical protein